MGLFMDGNGMPLAFCMNPGAEKDQPSLIPLEKRIENDFAMSKFIVCTDGGQERIPLGFCRYAPASRCVLPLGSFGNRLYNDKGGRGFVTVRSIKKMEEELQVWALDQEGWSLPGSDEVVDLAKIDDTSENKKIYYKERKVRTEGTVDGRR
jgi:hypothetical protein